MKLHQKHLLAGLCAGWLGSAGGVCGHALIVDLDPVTPGIQTTISVTPGTPVVADIHLVDDGITPITGYGVGTNFNDTPGVLGLVPPTVAGPGVAAVLAPADLATGGGAIFGGPLGVVGVGPFGVGPGGPFTASDGGAGYYDFFPFAWVGMPGLGGSIVLQTVTFVAGGPVGATSDVVPLGILAPGAPLGPIPPVAGAGGLEFYDAGFLGAYGAAGFGPGANPMFPAGIPAITPGTVTIVPEPSCALLGSLGLATLLIRRRHR